MSQKPLAAFFDLIATKTFQRNSNRAATINQSLPLARLSSFFRRHFHLLAFLRFQSDSLEPVGLRAHHRLYQLLCRCSPISALSRTGDFVPEVQTYSLLARSHQVCYSGLGNLCKIPESGFERAEMKSR